MGLRLFFLLNFPGDTFIQGGTLIPDSRVHLFWAARKRLNSDLSLAFYEFLFQGFLSNRFKLLKFDDLVKIIYIFLNFQGLRTSRRWTRSRTLWPRSWLRHRDCRRRGCPGYRTTTPIVCRNDPDPHFRRGPGSLWAYCGHLPIHEIRRISPMLHHQF